MSSFLNNTGLDFLLEKLKKNFDKKADKSTTLAGYGITDAATSTQGDKADSAVQTIQINGTTQTKTNGVVNLPAYPTTLPASNTTDTYSATGTAPVSGKAVASAIGGLDVTGTTAFGAGKTISAWSETDGKVSITSQNISITKSQVSDFPSSMPASDVKAWAKADNKPTYTASEVGALASTVTHLSGDVPTTRKVNGKALSADVTLTAADVGAATAQDISDAIDALPEPMVFKGSLGTGGTITTLPTAASTNTGYTYKVITAGTYASQTAKVGDTFISTGSKWELIPSGDEPNGTVTSVTISATSPIAIDNSAAITTSGTRTISHANSGATAGSYGDNANQTPAYGGTFKVPYVTVNATGHVTGISEHTVKIPASDNTNTTYTFAEGSTNGAFSVTPSSGTATSVKVHGLGSLAYSSATIPTITDTYSATSSNGMSGKAVASAISGKANSSDIPTAETTNIDFSKEW